MLKKILLSLISGLLAIIFVEVVLRMFFPVYTVSPASAYQYDPELGVRLRPGTHILETTDFQQEIRVNSLGTVNFQETFDDYGSIVFAVGDSFTQGTGLPSDMSYPAQLDLFLNTSAEGYVKKHGVVNLGLAAYGGEQNLIAIRRFSESIRKPSVILYLGSDNDYEDDQLFLSGYSSGHIVEGSPTWGVFARPMQWLTNDFQLGLRLKLLVGGLRRSSVIDRQNSGQDHGPSVAELEGPVLDRILQLSRESGSTLIVSWAGPGRSYDWTKAWAERNGVAFADWDSKVVSVTRAVPALPLDNPHSGGHHRGWVNRIIAEEFGRLIEPEKNEDAP